MDEILEKLPDEFNVPEMMARVEDRTPYTVVAFQECERMNILTSEIKRSLKELDLGLKVSPEFQCKRNSIIILSLVARFPAVYHPRPSMSQLAL